MNWMRASVALLLSAFLAVVAGCSPNDAVTEPPRRESLPASTSISSSDAISSTPQRGYPRIAILGDSLTAGLGLPSDQTYLALLQRRLDSMGLKYDMVNAGVSGDTSAGGLRRVDWALQGDVRILIVALGGNDGLRGLPIEQLRVNLGGIIERGQRKGATVILAGMEAPTNYGPDYTHAFHQVYPDLAQKYNVPLIPFLLDGVAAIPEMNQRDGIHPNPAGARIVEQTIWTALAPVLTRTHQ